MESRSEKFERWAKQWDDKLPNLAKALRSKDLQDELAFIENYNPMTPTLSSKTLQQIEWEAEAYADLQSGDKGKIIDAINSLKWEDAKEDYAAGATAYAHYKEMFDQAKKALGEIEELTKRNWSENSNIDIYLKCRDTLSSWKEEGKGGENGKS